MIDKTKNETESIEYASRQLGEFFEECVSKGIGTDVYKWDPETYYAMVEAAITSFVERMQELNAAEE